MGNYQNLMSPYFSEEVVNKYITTKTNDTQLLFDSFKMYQKSQGLISLKSFSYLLRNSNPEFSLKLFKVFKSRKEGLSFQDFKSFYVTFKTANPVNTIGFFSELIFGLDKTLKPIDYLKTIKLLFDNTDLRALFVEDSVIASMRILDETTKERVYSKERFISACATSLKSFFQKFRFMSPYLPCSHLSGNQLELKEIFKKYNFICQCGKKDREMNQTKRTEKEDIEYENMKDAFGKIEYDNRGLFNIDLLKGYFNKVAIMPQLQNIIISYLRKITMKPYIDFITFKSFMLECKKSPVDLCKFFMKMILYPNSEAKKALVEQVTVVKLIDIQEDVIRIDEAIRYLEYFKGYLQNIERINIIPFAFFGIKPITMYRLNQILDFLMEGFTWEEYLTERIEAEKVYYAIDISLWNIIEQIGNDDEIPTEFDNQKIASNGFYLKENTGKYKEHFFVVPQSIYLFLKKWFGIKADIQLNRITHLNKERPKNVKASAKPQEFLMDNTSLFIVKDQFRYEIVLYPLHVDVYFFSALYEEVKDRKHKFTRVTDNLYRMLQLPEKQQRNSLLLSKANLFAEIKQQFQMHEMFPIKMYIYHNNKFYEPNDDRCFLQEKINDFCLLIIDTQDKGQYFFDKCHLSSTKAHATDQTSVNDSVNNSNLNHVQVNSKEKPNTESVNQSKVPVRRERDDTPPQIGLRNLGNTCYFNSVLQLFVNMPILDYLFTSPKLIYFINPENKFSQKGKFLKAYYSILFNRDKEDSSPDDITKAIAYFKKTIGGINEQFNNTNQQDANELMTFLLETLHEEINIKSTKEYLINPPQIESNTDEEMSALNFANSMRRGASFIDSLFLFQLKSNLSCEKCASTKVSYETNYILDLPVLMETMIEIEVTLHRLPFEMKVYYPSINEDFKRYCSEHSNESLYENLASYCRDLIESNTEPSTYYLSKKNCSVPVVFSMKINRNVPFSALTDKLRQIAELELEPLIPPDEYNDGKRYATLNDQVSTKVNRMMTAFLSTQSEGKVFPLDRLVDDCFPTECKRITIHEQLNSNGVFALMSNERPQDVLLISHSIKDNTLKSIDAFRYQYDSFNSILSVEDYLSFYSKQHINESTFPVQNLQIEYPIYIYHYYVIPRYSHPLYDYHHSKLPFNTQFLIANNSLMNYTAKALYDFIWESNKRMLKSPGKADSELWWRTTKKDPKNDKLILASVCYPFILRSCYYDYQMIRCAKCPWYSFCPGCIINPYDESPLLLASDTCIAVDWSYQVINEEFVQSYLRVFYTFNNVKPMKDELSLTRTSTLDDCLRLFCAKEKLEDELYCDKCLSHQLFSKNYDLFKPPQILVISLKRFKYNAFSRYKISTFINYPLKDLKIKDKEYNLYGVVHHYGNIIGGHYTSTIKCGDTWMTFDDDHVFPVSESKALDASAYMLVYSSKRSIEKNDYYQTLFSLMSCIDDSNPKKPTFSQNRLYFKGEPIRTPYGRGYCVETIEDDREIIPVKFQFGEGFINKANVEKETLLQYQLQGEQKAKNFLTETFLVLDKEDFKEENSLLKGNLNHHPVNQAGICRII